MSILSNNDPQTNLQVTQYENKLRQQTKDTFAQKKLDLRSSDIKMKRSNDVKMDLNPISSNLSNISIESVNLSPKNNTISYDNQGFVIEFKIQKNDPRDNLGYLQESIDGHFDWKVWEKCDITNK